VKLVRRTVLPALLTASALVPGGVSHAGTLASALIAGRGSGVNQVIRCFLTNVGTKAIQVESVAIRDVTLGAATPLSFNDCTTSPLQPTRTCQFANDPPATSGFGEVTVKGGTKSLRGLCQAFTTDDDLVRSESEMR
jgi:hypothetical protein